MDATNLHVRYGKQTDGAGSVVWQSSDCYTQSRSSFPSDGKGMVGFLNEWGDYFNLDDFTIWVDHNANGMYESSEIEHADTFDVAGDGYVSIAPTYDLAGNLTYDGLFSYGYDAWNRMVKLTKSYRDGGGALHNGSVLSTMRYDGAGRRIEKAVQNSADLDCTYGYYYDRMSMIEARNGSSQTIQQYVWGLDYIDELIQVSNNTDPTTDNTCETSYWACLDANFNVSRLVGVIGLDENSQPVYGTTERYEYTPYGQRTVFFSAGSNDPDAYAPTLISRRVTDGMTTQPYGICPIGHQGLVQDEESGLAYGRERMWNLLLRRGNQRDPMGYVDGMSLYQYVQSNPIINRDPMGTCTCGLDITRQVEQIEQVVTKAYNSPNMSMIDYFELYNALYSANGWDIDELAFGKDRFSLSYCGTGKCRGTVSIRGRCYNAEEVNYYLFGLGNRLSMDNPIVANNLLLGAPKTESDWIGKMANAIYYYRTLRWGDLPNGSPIAGRVAWATAGFIGDIDAAAISQRKDCLQCGIPYSGTLQITWGKPGGNTRWITGVVKYN